VWWVALAEVADGAGVPQAIASALGLPHAVGPTPVDALVGWLRTKQLLLVLDNCEHVAEACAALASALLRACPQLQIVATSRQPLGVAGEITWRIPALAMPNPSDQRALQMYLGGATDGYEALRLFEERAAAVLPGFRVGARNLQAVTDICHRLDGLPLAIELAAARVKVLAPQQIAARLADRFLLLTGGNRTALPQHQTLRAALDWSYDLLSDAEQELLNQLCVFHGSWDVAAVESVCVIGETGGSGAGANERESDVLDVLSRLVDKSLVVAQDAGAVLRYRLLETVQHYAFERLKASGRLDAARRRHAAYYLALLEAAATAPGRSEAGPGDWPEQLVVESANVRAAHAYLLETGAQSQAAQLATALRALWPDAEQVLAGSSALDVTLYQRGTAPESHHPLAHDLAPAAAAG
jgi:predicted ATPase